MKRWVLALGVGLLGLSGFSQVLRIAFDAADLKTLDPHYAAATMDRAVVDMVFNGLVRYKPGDITVIEPDLATSWEVSEDGLVWTFYLRQGVLVHPFPGAPEG
ncbi:MAG: ABC transporter substrate-binding protein, partial [Candidatus Methanomethyliaceae archaeon]